MRIHRSYIERHACYAYKQWFLRFDEEWFETNDVWAERILIEAERTPRAPSDIGEWLLDRVPLPAEQHPVWTKSAADLYPGLPARMEGETEGAFMERIRRIAIEMTPSEWANVWKWDGARIFAWVATFDVEIVDDGDAEPEEEEEEDLDVDALCVARGLTSTEAAARALVRSGFQRVRAADYGEQYADDVGIEIPPLLIGNIDWNGVGKDLLGDHEYAMEDSDGYWYVFTGE